MVVVETLGVGLGAGRVAELDVGELLSCLDHVVLMTKGVSEDDVAASIRELGRGVVALLALGDVRLDHVCVFADAQLLARLLGGVNEVEVIGGVLVMQRDEARLDGFGVGRAVIRACAGARATAIACTAGQRQRYYAATSKLDKLRTAEGVLGNALHDTHPFKLEPCSVPITAPAVFRKNSTDVQTRGDHVPIAHIADPSVNVKEMMIYAGLSPKSMSTSGASPQSFSSR